MKYSHNAVQMCLASIEYDERDYIRDYNEFMIIPFKNYEQVSGIARLLLENSLEMLGHHVHKAKSDY